VKRWSCRGLRVVEVTRFSQVTDFAVPPSNRMGRARTIVLCFDGTGNQFNENVSDFTN